MGEILRRFEQHGMKISALRFHQMTKEEAYDLYEEHIGKSFFENLVEFATSGPALFLILEAPRCVELVRHIIGNTDPLKADLGTIRGDFAVSVTKNLIHASDSPESYEREHRIFFKDSDIKDYHLDVQNDL
jgi:nucleoside-diphosphate kinase